MNNTEQNNYLERVFSRSCLESSPRSAAPYHGLFSPAIRSSSKTQSQLHQLKQTLLHNTLIGTMEIGLFKPICGAANQAAELAWNETHPLLVFPGLFEELVQIAREQFQQEQGWQLDEPPWPPVEDQNASISGKEYLSVSDILPAL